MTVVHPPLVDGAHYRVEFRGVGENGGLRIAPPPRLTWVPPEIIEGCASAVERIVGAEPDWQVGDYLLLIHPPWGELTWESHHYALCEDGYWRQLGRADRQISASVVTTAWAEGRVTALVAGGRPVVEEE